jgi:hypothetical protein
LVELLTVIAVVAVLASLVVASVSKVRTSALKSQASSNLRQVGAAVLSFANENGGYLPGPSGLGLVPYYYNPYPQETNLAAAIAPYLDVPASTPRGSAGVVFVPVLLCPAAAEAVEVAEGERPPPYYVQNYTLDIPRGRVFGAQAIGESEATVGWMLSRIEELGQPGDIWLLMDLDQNLPTDMPHPRGNGVSSSGWFSKLPDAPVWADGRMRLYLDGHVGYVPLDAEP